ncbi:probable G-protein coupled receptor B0563.6 isoform X2 [Neocloeon triangulifer]|uniref:probable G-protein coupled receptor B0563.6 isoform X2 n=1 Tax=Neocloeon triangulifer TaxID=2078957 RepID=UPI00286F9174|nr:probable G-protein coupled receptor B0563.6 isoform X2 [Neocloeon triangulifer]
MPIMDAIFSSSTLEDLSVPLVGGEEPPQTVPGSTVPLALCPFVPRENITLNDEEDPRITALKQAAYGIALPAICTLGVVGNLLNLVVLTRRNMKGTAYIYMRGYAAASLLAILFAIPFGLRVVSRREAGQWSSLPQAFYHAHLELFLGNACLGVGVLMLLALTIERYAAVCQLNGGSSPHRARTAVALIPVLTFLLYLPNAFRTHLTRCGAPYGPEGEMTVVFQRRDNIRFLHSAFYSIYKIALEIIFKVGPTILLAGLNARILIVYRRSCARRRKRRGALLESCRQYAEEKRLALLLGSTSLLFFACVSPMVILNVTLSERNLSSYNYQIFRAIANVLEVTNYSLTFYIYCLFSEDFRSTLLRTVNWPWWGGKAPANGLGVGPTAKGLKGSPPITQQTTATPTPPRACTLACATSTTGAATTAVLAANGN